MKFDKNLTTVLLQCLGGIFLMALIIIFIVSIANAEPVDDAFQKANEYTVKIKTTVQLPFLNDRKGSFTGTGFLVDEKKGCVRLQMKVDR